MRNQTAPQVLTGAANSPLTKSSLDEVGMV